jgi:hypothetical protein
MHAQPLLLSACQVVFFKPSRPDQWLKVYGRLDERGQVVAVERKSEGGLFAALDQYLKSAKVKFRVRGMEATGVGGRGGSGRGQACWLKDCVVIIIIIIRLILPREHTPAQCPWSTTAQSDHGATVIELTLTVLPVCRVCCNCGLNHRHCVAHLSAPPLAFHAGAV